MVPLPVPAPFCVISPPNNQTGARQDGPENTLSRFKLNTWQSLMKSLDSERPRCFTGGVEREEVADSILFFTTSCSCHIEAVSNWPPTILSCPIISQLIESISGYTNSQPCCTCKAAVQSGCSYFLYCNVHAYCIFWVGTQSEALPPSKAPWGWDNTKNLTLISEVMNVWPGDALTVMNEHLTCTFDFCELVFSETNTGNRPAPFLLK